MENNWYQLDNINELDTPALVVYPDRVKNNIQRAVGMVQDISLFRPHIKTNKSPDAVRLMLDAGIYKFKCATIAEAEILGNAEAKDVLLAYQPAGPKLKRFSALIKKFPGTAFSCLVDNSDTAKEQSAFFADEGLTVPVFIDINTGMNRTGILPEKVMELYRYASSLNGYTVKGGHVYDGHFRNPDFNERKKECDSAFTQIEALKREIMQSGFAEPVIVAGGSPTFPIHAQRGNVECSPGTFVYWDKGYADLCAEQPFETAAVLVTRVISVLSDGKICTDLGHKSVAAENAIERRVFFLNAGPFKPAGQSEEHLVLETPERHSYKVGDVFYALPYHICPTVALYEKVFTATGGKITGSWKTVARDRSLTI